MSRDMTKPTMWLCAQRRLRSAWASAQSDRSLRCPHKESLGPQLPIERTAKTPIRLGECPGWSADSDPTGRTLIWYFAGRTLILLVLSWGGSSGLLNRPFRTIRAHLQFWSICFCMFQCLLMMRIYGVNLKHESGILRSKSLICWNFNYQSTYLSSATRAHLLMKEFPFNFIWQQGVTCLCCMSCNALYSTLCVQNKLCFPVK